MRDFNERYDLLIKENLNVRFSHRCELLYSYNLYSQRDWKKNRFPGRARSRTRKQSWLFAGLGEREASLLGNSPSSEWWNASSLGSSELFRPWLFRDHINLSPGDETSGTQPDNLSYATRELVSRAAQESKISYKHLGIRIYLFRGLENGR